MRVFVAGATGVIGRALVPKLVAQGHTVIGMTRSLARGAELRKSGVEPVVCDAFDERAVVDAIVKAKPEVVIHQLTALPRKMNPRKIEREARETNRLRIEGTHNLLAGARAAGARRFIAQSIAFVTRPDGLEVQDETAPLYSDAPEVFRSLIDAVASLEEQTVSAKGLVGVVLRYGFFYGPGTVFDEHEAIAEGIDRRMVPVVGDANGVWSFVHVDDAADATIKAMGDVPAGIYNIVDDEPVRSGEWIPYLANARHAPKPLHVPLWAAKIGAGKYGVYLMNEVRGATNAKAKNLLGWTPRHPSWREGFRLSAKA